MRYRGGRTLAVRVVGGCDGMIAVTVDGLTGATSIGFDNFVAFFDGFAAIFAAGSNGFG